MSSRLYARYALSVLTAVYTLNYVDRSLITLLLQPIKEDLRLTDTQLGLVTGIAFGLFYATLGIPIARWADRGNRTTVTSLAIALWGATVMLCVFVGNFLQLLCTRIAAAVGEAGCMPPTYSLVGDYFPQPAERTRAMSVYMMAAPLSGLIGFGLGGWLNEHYGWRATFAIMGLPGLMLAALVKATLVDPRVRQDGTRVEQGYWSHIARVTTTLLRQRTSRHLTFAIILLFTMSAGMAPWYAAFLMRSHGMGTAELGLWVGLIFGLGGVAGILLGGYTASTWWSENERSQMRMSAFTVASLVPFFVAFLLLPTKGEALLALIPLTLVFNCFLGPTFALLQRLVADEMRATTLAVVMLFANLIGIGIGPQLVGILSDNLTPSLGVNSLRCAMLITSLMALWSAYHFWVAGWTVREDLSETTSHSMTRPTVSPLLRHPVEPSRSSE